jgi:Protein of unknown function (DUF2889)
LPLSPSASRREIHHRIIDMKAYARDDGLYDVEAHLVDRKPFDLPRIASPIPLPAGQPIHDLWVRLTVDDQFVVRDIEAVSDVTPFDVCKKAESTLRSLIGERIASGWSSKVKERLRGSASCTHLMEMLIPMATTTLQGVRALQRMNDHSMSPEEASTKIDSCYAYAAHRDVVLKFWPQYYRPKQAATIE